MKNFKTIVTSSAIMVGSLALVSCGSTSTEAEAPVETMTETEAETEVEAETEEIVEVEEPTTVEITDIHGTVEVPINPEVVVALDNRSYETLEDWGIELAAAPKGVMPDDLSYVTDESVQDIGSHREPNLEIIAAVQPDLVIVGQRFAGYYDAIKEIVPESTVIDLNLDVSEEAEDPGENLVSGFVHNTTVLGQIFDKEDEANALIGEFEASIDEVKEAYNGEDVIMSVIVSGGNIGFSAPGYGRVWGPLYNIFGFVPALGVDGSTTDHQGDEISIEAIAESNPDWIFVLDRDAGVSSEDSLPAEDIINGSPALQNTTAIIDGNILYAPNDTYTNESIQTFTELFNSIADAFNNKN
ncbi:MAG: siderophore ABC transporter substrate-binding protein [Lachnospirales bacterium]